MRDFLAFLLACGPFLFCLTIVSAVAAYTLRLDMSASKREAESSVVKTEETVAEETAAPTTPLDPNTVRVRRRLPGRARQ